MILRLCFEFSDFFLSLFFHLNEFDRYVQGWCLARGQRSGGAQAQSTMLDHRARHEGWDVELWVVALRNAAHGECAWRELLLGKSALDIGSQGLTATVCVSMYTGLSETFLVEVDLSSVLFGPRWERCAPQCAEA